MIEMSAVNKMNALVINCSPVRNGATAEIAKVISSCLIPQYDVKVICIDDYQFNFCKGCRSCHNTAKCILQEDDVANIMAELEWADRIISVSPSYWADKNNLNDITGFTQISRVVYKKRQKL
jgi:multimeric flavodoxin WrbA